MKRKGLIFVISAPSGCGKTTLCNKLFSSSLGLIRSVSITTRSPRKGERAGKDYFFISKREFGAKKKAGEFIEWVEIFGNLYGTPRKTLEKAVNEGKDILLSLDTQGALKIKQMFPRAVLIFILPPSTRALKDRLKMRSTENKKEISERLCLAGEEISYLNKYNYSVVNNNIADAFNRLKAIVVAERHRIEDKL